MRGSDFLPFGARLVKLIKGAMDHYAVLVGVPARDRRPILIAWVETQLTDWNPSVKGVDVLDSECREALSTLVGGMAFLVSDELNKRGAA